jgi:AcrR family transcriptional regulator
MDTLERIVEGSGELFLRSGIKSITMDDIAKNLGISKKTIYQHFADKNELVSAVVKYKLQADEKQMKEILQSTDNVIEQLHSMTKCSEEVLIKINASAFHDMKKYYPEAFKLFQEFKRNHIVKTLEEVLNKGIKQGYIRPDIDVKIMAYMRVNQIEMGFDNDLFPPALYNVWQVQQQFQDHFNYGICTLKGYKLLNQYKEATLA